MFLQESKDRLHLHSSLKKLIVPVQQNRTLVSLLRLIADRHVVAGAPLHDQARRPPVTGGPLGLLPGVILAQLHKKPTCVVPQQARPLLRRGHGPEGLRAVRRQGAQRVDGVQPVLCGSQADHNTARLLVLPELHICVALQLQLDHGGAVHPPLGGVNRLDVLAGVLGAGELRQDLHPLRPGQG